MAKLDGVKLVSESITYNGVEYTQSDAEAAVGDIVRYDDNNREYVTDGGFYVVTWIDSVDDPQITDDEGDNYDLCGEDYTVFKSSSTAKSGVDVVENVVISGVTYVKTAGVSAGVGDYIRFESDDYRRMTEGGYYEVTSVDDSGDAHVTNDDGNDFDTVGDSFTVYKAVTSAVSPHEVKRRAAVGERIKIVDATLTGGNYENGAELTVKAVIRGHAYQSDHILVDFNGSDHLILDSEYVVLETPLHTEVDHAAKVGERIRIVKRDVSERDYESGAEFIVSSVDSVGDVYVTLNGDARKLVLRDEYAVLVPIAEVAESTQPPVKPLKVGDYVRITEFVFGHGVGTIGIVTEVKDPNSHTNRVDVEANGNIYAERNVEHVTPAEAEAVRKQAEEIAKQRELERKWAAIGRKVGEFKAGDVVRVIDASNSILRKGDIGTVSDTGDGDFRVNTVIADYANWLRPEHVQLIAPVESLFNAASV